MICGLETHASNYYKIHCKMELAFGENFTELSGIFDKILKSTKEIIAQGNKKIRDKRDVKIREQRERER